MLKKHNSNTYIVSRYSIADLPASPLTLTLSPQGERELMGKVRPLRGVGSTPREGWGGRRWFLSGKAALYKIASRFYEAIL